MVDGCTSFSQDFEARIQTREVLMERVREYERIAPFKESFTKFYSVILTVDFPHLSSISVAVIQALELKTSPEGIAASMPQHATCRDGARRKEVFVANDDSSSRWLSRRSEAGEAGEKAGHGACSDTTWVCLNMGDNMGWYGIPLNISESKQS